MLPSLSRLIRFLFSLALPACAACTPRAPSHAEHGAHADPTGGVHHGTMPHRFENAEAWAKRFEDPARDAWQKPDEVVAALELRPDAKVADVGAGTGYFAVRLARAVPHGRVYAVDIEPDMVRYLGERARREGLENLTAVQGEPADAKLPEPVDLVLVVDTYHHIGERVAYFQGLRAKLAPGGRLAIIDYRKESPRGPPPQHKLAPGKVGAELKAAGYRPVASHGFLPDQYFLVFEPA